MARFTNQAQLNYNGITKNSNVAVGEITEALTATKEALKNTYASGDTVTYTLSYVNSSSSPLSAITITDNLGAYSFGTTNIVPLTYVADSLRLYINGVLQPSPTVTAGNTLSISGITIPAGGNAVIIYEATVNEFAPLTEGSTITNIASTSTGTVTPAVTATETITVQTAADLSITKSISPIPVSDNEQLTYTFTIQNYGNTAANAEDSVTLSDTFNPILSDISVSVNGTALTAGTDYSYSEATGVFNTVAGRITVPAATYTQDPATGSVTITPGVTTVVISGTV